tara:strand:+ start:2619 stop:3809 length:1191 start_codon:yes stop_codon:yes gene_type:complete
MDKSFYNNIAKDLEQLKADGLFKGERKITSPQHSLIKLDDGKEVINLCSNNYLGLANNSELINTAKKALDNQGYGLASVRFICGTQDIHKKLEAKIANFLNKEDVILYSSCFDANGGLFECILNKEDAIISDALNHASIIDGVRLCKAQRFVYANNNMEELEKALIAAKNCRYRLIATDGVFSMDGIIANLKAVCDLADKYDALVMVDDSHATGFLGKKGRGSVEFCDVLDRVDIITSTLGKALGGASGGFTAGNKHLIAWLRQRSRPYLFSNTIAPVIAATSIKVFEMLENGDELRNKLIRNSEYFRAKMTQLGFDLIPGEHPIIPVMLGDAKLASTMADELLKEGVYVIGFSFPVVPKGKARIRTQMSAALEIEHLDKAIAAFEKVGKKLKIIN